MSPRRQVKQTSRWRRPNKRNTNLQTRRYKHKSSNRMKKIELRKKLERYQQQEEDE